MSRCVQNTSGKKSLGYLKILIRTTIPSTHAWLLLIDLPIPFSHELFIKVSAIQFDISQVPLLSNTNGLKAIEADGEIMEEYDSWRYHYPVFGITQRWAKVSSQVLRNMLTEGLKLNK